MAKQIIVLAAGFDRFPVLFTDYRLSGLLSQSCNANPVCPMDKRSITFS